jgi:hypothetical protein
MQEAATFIAYVVARTTPTPFSVLESIFVQTADEVSKMVEFTTQVDVSIILRRILSGYAEKVKNQVVDAACVQIRKEVQVLDFYGVFASKTISQKYIIAAKHDFEFQCDRYYQGLLVEIRDEASTYQVHIEKALADFCTAESIERLRMTSGPIISIIKQYRVALQYPISVLNDVKSTWEKRVQELRPRLATVEGEIAALDTRDLVLVWEDRWREGDGMYPTHSCHYNTGGIPMAYIDENIHRLTHSTSRYVTDAVFQVSYKAEFWCNCVGQVKIYVRKQDQHRAKLAQLGADKARISTELTGIVNQKIPKVDAIMKFVEDSGLKYRTAASRVQQLDRLCRGGPSEDRIERTFQDLIAHAGCTAGQPDVATPATIDVEMAYSLIQSFK